MRPGAASPAAATGRLSGPAASASASGSGCSRLIDGTVRRKDPILEDRPDDLTAIERGTGKVRERVSQARPRYLHRLRLSGGDFGRCCVPRMHVPLQPGLGAAESKHGPVTFRIAPDGGNFRPRP